MQVIITFLVSILNIICEYIIFSLLINKFSIREELLKYIYYETTKYLIKTLQRKNVFIN